MGAEGSGHALDLYNFTERCKFKKAFLLFFICMSMILIACGCAVEKQADLAQAELALREFFDALADGEYTEAAAFFSGEMAFLESANPDISPEDQAALWQASCTQNGLQCLPVMEVVSAEQLSEDLFVFVVEFEGSDGEVFALGACCEEETEEEPTTRFTYRVAYEGGKYLVLDLPVYVP